MATKQDREFEILNMQTRTAAENLERAERLNTPSMMLKPRLSVDGDQWCALHGENLQDGVAGFGDSPEDAYHDFDHSWRKALKKDGNL